MLRTKFSGNTSSNTYPVVMQHIRRAIKWLLRQSQHFRRPLIILPHLTRAKHRQITPWDSRFLHINRHMELFSTHTVDLFKNYAPINVNALRARGGDLTNFEIFGSNSPGWETKGRSKVSKKPPLQGKKSKQTIP